MCRIYIRNKICYKKHASYMNNAYIMHSILVLVFVSKINEALVEAFSHCAQVKTPSVGFTYFI